VSVETAHLPNGWRDRLVPFDRPDAAPSQAVALEPHDLVIAKLYAGREKDLEFAIALIRENLVDTRLLVERAGMLSEPEAVRERVRSYIERCRNDAAKAL